METTSNLSLSLDPNSGPEATEQMITQINKLSPSELNQSQVHVRKLKLTGNKLNSYYGQIRTSDLSRLAELTVGAPLLIGHQKDSKPIGRFFDASSDNEFVLASFYVPSARSDADDLMADIDSGVLNEASISFQFSGMTCGICQQNFLSCPHQVSHDYEGEIGYYLYDNIKKVLEGSLVYRGAHPETGFTDLIRKRVRPTVEGATRVVL